MIQAIHTAVKGRVRYKVPLLYRSETLKKHVELKLSKEEGIYQVSANPLTGNVLVVFNSDNNVPKIASLIENILLEHKDRESNAITTKDLPTNSDLELPIRSTSSEHRTPTKQPLSPLKDSSRPTRKGKLRKLVTQAEEQKVESWYFQDSESALAEWNTSRELGLSHELVKENLERYGPNILPESVPRSGLSIFFDQLNSLPVALLGVAAGISVFTGGIADAFVILGVVAINATIGYITETQSERTINSLKSLVRPSALVIRDGNQIEVKAEEVVPGDLLILRPGSYIPADSRLIEAHRLSIDESALTGESMPVLKTVEPLPAGKDIPLADRINMVYMGTLVTGGQGFAVVVATGKYTEIGQIQSLVGKAESPKTPMERQLTRMGSQLVLISGAVCGVVFGIGLLYGYSFTQMLTTSISLAVAAVPEGLPTVATTTLALGIRNMRRHKVLIRKLDAVETLGSVQTFCLDKTGTITLNKMSVVAVHTGMRPLKVSEDKFITEDGPINPFDCEELLRLIHVSALCSETEVSRENGKYVLRGSPTENALVHVGLSSGVDVLNLRETYPVLKINHRAEGRNYMSTLHRVNQRRTINNGGDPHQPPLFLAIKGSPPEVLAMCLWQLKDGVKIPLTDEDRFLIENENERMAGKALRVLGTAQTYLDEGSDTNVREGLIWLGLVGMIDPVRKGVKEVIGNLHQAGIDTVMITGDQSPTAYAVGKELNLSRGQQLEILDSTLLTTMNPEVLKGLSERVHVFARVSPAHKLQIVQALQKARRVIAMTGDGINDGPALRAADIGVAMGNTGTDVAREVADVVLEDDNLETMVVAISQGRTIYNNIRKAVHFLLATNLSEIMVMFFALAAGLGHPLNAMQLLWINLISDIFPGLALALEPPEPDVLSRPPRDPEEPIIKASDFKRVTFEAGTLAASSLGVYGYGIMKYGAGPRAGTLAFTSLTTGQLLHAISCRSETHSLFDVVRVTGQSPLPPNPYLTLALGGSFASQALAMMIPGLRNLLGTTPISLVDGLVVGGSALLSLMINEMTKRKLTSPAPS
jgi:Ca2+-transporting ATPase